MRRSVAVGAAAVSLLALSACSPTDLHTYVYGNHAGYHVDAAAGGNDGGGSRFRAEVVCSGENFWRRDDWVSVDTASNWPGGRFASEVVCPPGRIVVGTNIGRM